MSKPVELSGATVRDFPLTAIAAELRSSEEFAKTGRTARTLAKSPEMNLVLTVIGAGTALAEHRAPGAVSLVMIDGRIVFSGGPDGDLELAAGSAVGFAGGVAHSVRGIEDSAFLLAITRPHGEG